MKSFKIKMICRMLVIAMLVSLINIPVTFADNSLVMQIGTDGTKMIDRASTASVIESAAYLPSVSGGLKHGTLENVYKTPFINMIRQGNASIDVDNDFLNNINDATFEIWVDNNYFGNSYRNDRYLFGLYDETAAKEVFSVNLNIGATYDTRGYGFTGETNGVINYKQRGKDSTIFDDWVHIVATLDTSDDGSKTEYSLYMDGKRLGGNTINNIDNGDGTYKSAISSDDIRLRMGHSTLAGTHDKWYGFVGRLGDMKVYNYAMTDNDIASLYNSDKALYINDLSTDFSIEKQENTTTDKIEAVAVDSNNGYVTTPYHLGGTVKVSFTAPINKNSVSEETINLVDINGNVVPGSTSVEISDMGYVAYITYGQLTEGEQYAVKLNGLKSVNNVVITDVTSQYFTFNGGTATNDILLVRPFKGRKIEYTLNYPLAQDDFKASLCLQGTNFDLEEAEYDEATRTISLTATERLVAGKEYTVGYAGLTKTFTAVAEGDIVIEVPVAPVIPAPQIPTAPVEPEGSLLMNISVVDGTIVDTTGNGKVTRTVIPAIGGTVKTGYLANRNQTPYFEFTQNGPGLIEVDSDAIEGLDNMTFDLWVKNDDRNIDTQENQRNRYDNTLFAISDLDVDVNTTNPSIFKMGLHDGTTYAEAGYGFTGIAKNLEGTDIPARHYTTQSSMWDEWTHIVITKELPATGDYYLVKYYINGKYICTSWVQHTKGDVTEKVMDWDNTVLRIGHQDGIGKWDKWNGLIGKVSEFKAFNYVKTEADIKAQYEAQKYNYIEDLSDNFTLELVEASKDQKADYPRGPYAAGGKIKATFSAPVKPLTINERTLNLVDASGNVIPGGVTVELSEQGTVAYITYGEVAVGSEYYLKVDGLQSVNGVPLTVTSDAITFIDGGTAEKGILLVKPFKENKIDITLNYALKTSEFDASKAILSAGGYDYTDTTATYNEATRTITITGKENFVQRGKYLFTYDEYSKNFIAEEYVEPISVGTPVFKDQAGNEITTKTVSGVTSICSDVEVITDGTKEFVAILSVYCDGELVGMDVLGTNNSGNVNKFTNEVTELNSSLKYTFDLEVNTLDTEKEYTSKLMLWNTFDNMMPYTMFVPSAE